MEKSNKGLIIVLVLIIIILTVLCVLFATNTIELYQNKCDVPTVNDKDNNKEDAAAKIKEKLNDEEWVKENLNAKKNCFDEEVGNIEHHLKFSVLHDKNNSPVVIVLDQEDDSFLLACYRVYYADGKVVAQSITEKVEHPDHVVFEVDEGQGLVLYNWAHMGSYKFNAYDVKEKEIKIADNYSCEDCDDEYKGDKTYNPKTIAIELNKSNIDTYVK